MNTANDSVRGHDAIGVEELCCETVWHQNALLEASYLDMKKTDTLEPEKSSNKYFFYLNCQGYGKTTWQNIKLVNRASYCKMKEAAIVKDHRYVKVYSLQSIYADQILFTQKTTISNHFETRTSKKNS